MELKQTLLLGTLVGLVSCHWFDPTDVDLARQERTHVFVNAVVGADSTHCSISSVGSTPTSTTLEETIEACVRLDIAANVSSSTCGSGSPEGMGLWVRTPHFSSAEPGEELSLQVTFDRWDDLTATSMIPSEPTWSSARLKSRSIQEGDKIFDEVELNMIREAGEEKWHLIQLLLQIDTVFAPPPSPRNLRSDDPHVLVRKHGGSALDNALLVGNGGWIDNAWDLRFRVKNNVAEDVPHHYVLVVHSLSEELHGFWEDLEWARRNNGHVVSGNMSGGEGCFGVSRVGQALLFP